MAEARRTRRTINYTMNEADRISICLTCPLSRCVGNAAPRCPLYQEQLRRWRRQAKERREYFRLYKQRKKRAAQLYFFQDWPINSKIGLLYSARN